MQVKWFQLSSHSIQLCTTTDGKNAVEVHLDVPVDLSSAGESVPDEYARMRALVGLLNGDVPEPLAKALREIYPL